MNAKQAIDKIVEVLDLKFKSHKFAKTELVDGTKVTNNMDDEFRVGQELFIEKEDNVLEPAPMGTHETREGILVTVSETGIIEALEQKSDVAEDENEIEIERTDEMAEDKMDIAEVIIKALEPVMEEMKKMREDMKSMNDKFSKESNDLKKDMEAFKKSPERKSIVEKGTLKESFSDYQMDVIRQLRNK